MDITQHIQGDNGGIMSAEAQSISTMRIGTDRSAYIGADIGLDQEILNIADQLQGGNAVTMFHGESLLPMTG